MPKNSKLECSTLTQQKLAHSLKELMKEKVFDKISVANITENCGIHRQTFYYHFEDKYELLDWTIYTELVKPLINDLTLDNMYVKLTNMFVTMTEDKKFYQNALKMNNEDLARYIRKIAIVQLSQIMEDIQQTNNLQFDAELNKFSAEFFGYGISGIIIEWTRQGMKESPEDLTKRVESLVSVCKSLAIGRYLAGDSQI